MCPLRRINQFSFRVTDESIAYFFRPLKFYAKFNEMFGKQWFCFITAVPEHTHTKTAILNKITFFRGIMAREHTHING